MKFKLKDPGSSITHFIGMLRTHTQPIAIYNMEENHLGQVIQNAFTRIPTSAMPHTRVISLSWAEVSAILL